MYKGEDGYLDLQSQVILSGKDRGDRTGTGTSSLFSAQLMFDLRDSFPLLTTKKMAFNSIIGELLWFLSGRTNLETLRWFTFGDPDSDKRTIWDDNVGAWDDGVFGDGLGGGFIYGKQWRNFQGAFRTNHDQVASLLGEAKNNPESRRLLVNAWNSAEIEADLMCLPPCHFAWQVYIEDGYLNLKWNQRSCDLFLGIPFNIASYAALTHLLAHWLGLKPGYLIGDLTNVHIYKNHFDAVAEQLSRRPINCNTKLVIPEDINLSNLEDFWAGDFSIENYQSHPPIKAPMAV